MTILAPSTRCNGAIRFLGLLGLATVLTMPALSADQRARVQVVYHIDDTSRAIPAMRNINNHLKEVPDTKIVVVALGLGVDFLLKDAEDDHGNPYEPMLDDLVLAGVEFRACNNTLVSRQIDKKRLHPEVSLVGSGVAEITRLQWSEGHAYLKP